MSQGIVEWLSQDELDRVPSFKNWNDIDREKEQEGLWIETVEDKKLMKRVKQDTNWERAFLDLVKFSEASGYDLNGVVLDLAAGTCWTSAIISKLPKVRRVVAVDISRHRLEIIAPMVFEQYKADTRKITRVLGSFLNIKMEPSSVDFVTLIMGFHQTLDTDSLMKEVWRVLKPNGILLVGGEDVQPNAYYPKVVILHLIATIICALGLRRLVNRCLRKTIIMPRRIFPQPYCRQTGGGLTGERNRTVNDFVRVFKKYGFEPKIQRLNYKWSGDRGRSYSFLAVKR